MFSAPRIGVSGWRGAAPRTFAPDSKNPCAPTVYTIWWGYHFMFFKAQTQNLSTRLN